MKYFIDGFEDKKLKAISLICENCDVLYFEAFDIYELKLDNYYQLKSHFHKNSYDHYFDYLSIRIRRSCIPKEDENNTNPHESFKWKLNLHSICSVTLFFEDGDTVSAYLPYQEEIPNGLDKKDFTYRYNFSEDYIYDDDYLNINVTRRNLKSKKNIEQKKLIKIIKDYFKETFPKTNSVILFGDYAGRNYNEDSVVCLYVDAEVNNYLLKGYLEDLLDKSVFILSSKDIDIEDKYFKDTITII